MESEDPAELNDAYVVHSIDELRRHYEAPHAMVIAKQIDHIDAGAGALIAASPFLVLATCGPGGIDCSPKGDAPGFVTVLTQKLLLLPDRPGNNRLDGLQNILSNPLVGLIFFIPGIDEVLRVNGRARISVDPTLIARARRGGAAVRSVIVVEVAEAFLHCGRALKASKLWEGAAGERSGNLPSSLEVFKGHLALNNHRHVGD